MDRNSPKFLSDSGVFHGLRWFSEDISRPPGTILPAAGSLVEGIMPGTESNLSSDLTRALSSINFEQGNQAIEAQWQYDQDLDPMSHLRKTIRFKFDVASHRSNSDADGNSNLDQSARLERIGKAYYQQFHDNGQLVNVSEAIHCFTCSLFLTQQGNSRLPARLERLGLLHITRFENEVEPRLQDYEKAAIYINRAFSVSAPSRFDPLRRLSLVALIHESRFRRTGDPAEGATAIGYKTDMVSKMHQTSPQLLTLFESLGMLHEAQFRCTGKIENIKKAIEYFIQVVQVTPKDPGGHENLGIAYRTRSMHITVDSLRDIEQAVVHMRRAVDYTSREDKAYPRRLSNLGVAHEARFRYLGDLFDNEKAIKFKEKAVHYTDADVTNLPTRLESLGISYETRFRRLGQLGDIEIAIKHLRMAVDLTPHTDRELPRRLGNLGICHTALFERVHSQSDIQKSIEYLTRAVQCISEDRSDHPELPGLLGSLGVAYKFRYELGQDELHETDIEEAIKYLERAINITTSVNDGHPDLALRLDVLGTCYRIRFDPKADPEFHNLQKAIEYGEKAVHSTPDDHVDLAKRLTNLGISYQACYEHRKDRQRFIYQSKALGCFEDACGISIAPPYERLKSARHWAKLLSMSSSTGSTYARECLGVYQIAIDLVPDLVLLGADTRQRFQDLHQVRDLGVEASSFAIREKRNELAIEWLEQTRCVIWNQTLLLRSEAPLDQLRSMHPDFKHVDELQEIINKLHHSSLQVDIRSDVKVRAGSASSYTPSLVRTDLLDRYRAIISQIRELPGFKDFLGSKSASELIRSARSGPIVVINCHSSRCDALIISPGGTGIASVELPDYTFEEAQSSYLRMKSSLVAQGKRERGARRSKQANYMDQLRDGLASLWKGVAKPILEYLGYMDRNSTEDLPHITWCPTGIMTFLPLHAAGDYSSPSQPKVFDYAVSSYTPTLTALLSCNAFIFDHGCRIIAVGQGDPRSHPELGLDPLPGVDKELEFVKSHTQNRLIYSQLVGTDATQEKVLEAMSQNDWVHLACHARQDPNDPARSGFILHGSQLDLITIAQRLFVKKGLAFLSACQTATGDDNFPDEAAHLASCMLVAGYPSVIASMWSVMDEDAPLVADNVYNYLMSTQGIANGEVARALHNAVATLRKRVGMMNLDRWVQYIHMGM